MRTKHALKFKAKAKERLPYLEGLEGNSESCVNGKTAALNIIFFSSESCVNGKTVALNIIFFVYLIKIEWQQIWKQKRRLTIVNRSKLKNGKCQSGSINCQ